MMIINQLLRLYCSIYMDIQYLVSGFIFLHQSSNLINIFISNGNGFLYNDFAIVCRVLF